MLILGGHDYYDSASAFGIDKSIVFQRDKTEVSDKVNRKYAKEIQKILPALRGAPSHSSRNDFTSIITIVGGHYWRGVAYSSFPKISYAWSLKEINSLFDEIGEVQIEANSVDHPYIFRAITENYFGKNELPNSFLRLMIDNQDTIITAERWCRVFDDNDVRNIKRDQSNLKDFNFFRACDAFQTHQIISQWRSGVLPSAGVQMVEINDIDRLTKHGFDKLSFRKMPTKKRR